jgi:hypothetical protein
MAQTMHLFSKFAIEIRLKIWQYAMGPLVVRANWPSSKKQSGSKNNPVLLFVNRESRHEALRHYQKLDDDIYIDFRQDTIFMDSCFLSDVLDHPHHPILGVHESQIQILAVDYEFWTFFTYLVLQKLNRCPQVRKLVLVMPGYETPNWLDRGLFYELDNVPALITFQDLVPHNYDLFYFISGEVAEAIRFCKKRLHADTHWPDVYLVTYHTGTEVVQSPDWLTDVYLRDKTLNFFWKSTEWQQKGPRLPVPVFEMRMLLDEQVKK